MDKFVIYQTFASILCAIAHDIMCYLCTDTMHKLKSLQEDTKYQSEQALQGHSVPIMQKLQNYKNAQDVRISQFSLFLL